MRQILVRFDELLADKAAKNALSTLKSEIQAEFLTKEAIKKITETN